jgi:hypothetical protein
MSVLIEPADHRHPQWVKVDICQATDPGGAFAGKAL